MNFSNNPFSFDFSGLFKDLDNDAGYSRQFQKLSQMIPDGQPIMFMDATLNMKTGFEDETSELLEVFRILQPLYNYDKTSQNQSSPLGKELDIPKKQNESLLLQQKNLSVDLKEQTCCSCPKSKCLKLYCTCLQKGNYCGANCSCNQCFNDIWHEEDRQIVMNGQKFLNLFNGCHCKRSKCQQKYCECLNNNMNCTDACKCKGCKNHDHPHINSKNFKSYKNECIIDENTIILTIQQSEDTFELEKIKKINKLDRQNINFG